MTEKKSLGSQVSINVSGPKKLVGDLDGKLIDPLREQTGMKLTRSKIIKILIEIALESSEKIDTQGVYDEITLQNALKKAIKKTD